MNRTSLADIVPIVQVDDEEQLIEAVSILKHCQVIALDTEFDNMRTKYGMNLELIQIFDGDKVYLIRVCLIKHITVLKTIIEDSNIIKLVYSASEDIQALKSCGLSLQGLYDLQVASKLAGFESGSFIKIIKELIGVTLTKDEQKSNWRAKKLSDKQMAYAANDVIYNFKLYTIIKKVIYADQKEEILNEKNTAIEKTPPNKLAPKLKPKYRDLNIATNGKFFKLLELRDQLAKKRNVPPYYIFDEDLVAELARSGDTFECISSFRNCPGTYKSDSQEKSFINREIKNILTS
ncbi:hypothetical protein EXU57_09770 [Segetibacter sp. 3557_3]|uniref:HRDC domain-containing protein n=1 Tax=Segetibacter sp. 3557_3 TaxID=2547429 RepID=UPI0010588BD7|nr:HRDC domain-containing protein [Segetibacter sp. 3557_3]TDH26379.1 hypothetical protein EXU57_09770 [Segetibacter sp. 3557_3]